MGNCVHCFMVCSQIRHVSILDASPGFKKLQICHHICHIESEHGNIGHIMRIPHNLVYMPANEIKNCQVLCPV